MVVTDRFHCSFLFIPYSWQYVYLTVMFLQCMWYVRQRSAGSRKIVLAMYGLGKVKFQYWFWCWGGEGTPAPTPISNAMYIAGRQKVLYYIYVTLLIAANICSANNSKFWGVPKWTNQANVEGIFKIGYTTSDRMTKTLQWISTEPYPEI